MLCLSTQSVEQGKSVTVCGRSGSLQREKVFLLLINLSWGTIAHRLMCVHRVKPKPRGWGSESSGVPERGGWGGR